MIRFLFKCMLFAVLVLVAISLFAPKPRNERDPQQQEEGTTLTTLDAASAVGHTIGDLSGFCERNAQTCATGKTFLGSLGVRMRDGAKIAYEYLDSKFGAKDNTLPQGKEKPAPQLSKPPN